MTIRATFEKPAPAVAPRDAAPGRPPRMRSYLILGLIFMLVIWDIAQNRGQSLRTVGNWAAGFMRAIGLL